MSSFMGAIEYRPHVGEPMTLAILDRFTRAQVNGWNHTIDNLSLFFERALALRAEDPRVRELSSLDETVPAEKLVENPLLHELIGQYLENVRLLGTTDSGNAPRTCQPSGYTRIHPRAVHGLLPAKSLSRDVGSSDSVLRATAVEYPVPA
jgi:hypothetical protein